MLAVAEVNYIKHLREIEELSINEISRKTGCNWRTAKKYADGETSPPSLPIQKKGMMYDKGFGEIVDCWLEEDFKLRKRASNKQKNL